MGVYREHYIPADPPPAGRYVVWRRGRADWDWDVAVIDGDGQWKYPDASGCMHDVLWFMDVGGEQSRPTEWRAAAHESGRVEVVDEGESGNDAIAAIGGDRG